MVYGGIQFLLRCYIASVTSSAFQRVSARILQKHRLDWKYKMSATKQRFRALPQQAPGSGVFFYTIDC